MDGRGLAGFYYDSEKGKYFKILPNHIAPPGSKYTREKVERAEQQSKVGS